MKPAPSDHAESDFPAGLSAPARRALDEAGYTRLEQLTRVTEEEILKLHGVGPKTIPPLREALAAKGLAFAQKKSGKSG